MDRTKILVVINPKAGTKKKTKIEQQLTEVLSPYANLDFLYWESAEEDITQKIRCRLSKEVFEGVVVVGGDGTVNRAARALIGRKEFLLIVPVGSGNGLARHLHIPLNIKKSLKLFIEGKTIAIDVVKVDNEYYFCTAGVGFDAHVAHLFANAGKRGLMTYVKIILKTFFRTKSKIFKLSLTNKSYRYQPFLLRLPMLINGVTMYL